MVIHKKVGQSFGHRVTGFIGLLSHSLVIKLLGYFRTDRENQRGDIKDLICRLPILKSTYHKESFSTAKRAAFSISVENKESISTIERPNT